MALVLVKVLDRANNDNVLWSGTVDFTEPKSMIVLNSASGSVYKRVGPNDQTVNIFVGENISAAPKETRR